MQAMKVSGIVKLYEHKFQILGKVTLAFEGAKSEVRNARSSLHRCFQQTAV